MAPRPEEAARLSAEAAGSADGERVVISGMAGLYPQARYIKDLEHILYNKVNPITSDSLRWEYNHPDVAQYGGSIPELERFDAQFFKVHYKMSNNMDSMSRKILEQTYEAIYDAGLSPEHISGKKVGVYVGSCFSETEKACFYAAAGRSGFGIAGCSKSMFANRISYWLNAKGPSVSIDQACCSSTAALEAAYRAISHGECEAAVVGGAYLCLHPQSSVHFGRIMKISMDGKTKSFSEDADGCAKSEAINVLFLQKAKDAKRIYADVLYVKTEFRSILDGETGPKYGFYRNPADSAEFLRNFYKEAGIPPSVVEYVEAFGSAVPEADKSELESIERVFCENKREEPLLIGSVMSNIGYQEAASGISAITKVLLGYHDGRLAGNLYCDTPRRDVAAIRNGQMKVLVEPEHFRRTYTAVNSMSVSGVNAHVLLHGHYKPKDLNRYKTNLPRLVCISGRQDSAVERALGIIKAHPIDPEELALLHNIHETSITGHLGKGYTILATNGQGETVSLGQRAEYCDGAQRPLWFVYSGMGSQWAGMGAQLLRIPIFAAAIERCRKVLEPRGLDIVHIITSPDKSIFDNILHSFVGIAAIQIGLTDILLALGLVPDKIIGHSVGELGCAYADGCMTAEEMILSAYSRGRVSLETPFIRGSMAAVGLGAQQMAALCPPEIAIACHNSNESCTISGPAEAMRNFVNELKERGIFAKEVPCSNIAYHSRYIAEAGPGLLKYLREVIKTPRERTERWVSSSVPQARWDEQIAKYSSAEYHTNNLLSPVLFEEASSLIPADAVLVEVAPHGLLQAILKRALPDSASNIALTRRGNPDNVVMLLDAIGKLYLHGYFPKVRVLYPKVEFPVSTGTPMLSHYVEWAHQDKWTLALYQSARRNKTSNYTFKICIHDKEYSFLRGHVINNKNVVPASFALIAVWDTLAMSLDLPKRSIAVEFNDVKFFAQPILHERNTVKFSVSMHRGSGLFEVLNEDSKVATGYVKTNNLERLEMAKERQTECMDLSSKDAYSVLYERGCAYSGEFCNIINANTALTEATVSWTDNWVTLVESLIQLNILKQDSIGILQPERVRRLTLDPEELEEYIAESKDEKKLDVFISDLLHRTRCGGVVMEHVSFRNIPKTNENTVLETLKFVPRYGFELDVPNSLYVMLQVVSENLTQDCIQIIGLNLHKESNLYKAMENVAQKGIPGFKVDYRNVVVKSGVNTVDVFENANLVLMDNLSRDEMLKGMLHRLLQRGTFIINEDLLQANTAQIFPMNFYNIVSILKNSSTQLELARWRTVVSAPMTSAFTVRHQSDLPMLIHARRNCPSRNGLVILASYPPAAGLVNLVKKWRREPEGNNISVLMTSEKSNCNQEFGEMPDMNLAFNIYNDCAWGGEYFIPMEETPEENASVSLQNEIVGDLNSLKWMPMNKLTGNGTLVSVQYASLNMSDAKRALGLKTHVKSREFGMDFSGITERGDRVMGIEPNGSMKTQVLAQPELMWPVPKHWTLEDAATVPFAYMFAYYCLVLKFTPRIISKNAVSRSVLIHGGTGALGQAAINIALARGWQVFTTVRDAGKKRFLLKLFPQLDAKHIGNSRDASFADMVLSETNGNGCNMVICSLKQELKNRSLRCCGNCGSVVDTEQITSNANFLYGMNNLTKERSYIAADVASVLQDLKSEDVKRLHGLVCEGIRNGEVVPLTRVTFDRKNVRRAFQLLADSNHRGRAVIRIQHDISLPSMPKLTSEETCHVVICDSTPIGLQLAEQLIESGVKHLQLNVREPSGHLQYKIRSWKNKRINIAVNYGNLEESNCITNFLQNAAKLGMVESVHVVACNSIPDSVLQKLDITTRSLCPNLKHFIILTDDIYRGHSVCIERSELGLPATLLDLSSLETFQDPNGNIWHRGASDAMAKSWTKTETLMRALPKKSTSLTLIQRVSALTDLEINDNVDEETTLKDLGMQQDKINAVSYLLKTEYHTYIDDEKIPQLTVKQLKAIEEMITDKEFKQLKGLEQFFSFVDTDELLATTEMVYLNTLTNNYEMRDDEINVGETSLCIVPGMEGLAARFRALAERLKLPAPVLQPTLDRPADSPRELAARYSKILLKAGQKSPFYLLGYETGVIVALELAAILEENGLTGTVFCMGDGPAEIQAFMKRELGAVASEGDLESAVARHMVSLMAPGAAAAAEQALRQAGSWEARREACVRALRGLVPHSVQYARGLLDVARARVLTATHPLPEPTCLRSRVVLLRACNTLQTETNSLQAYSQNPINIENLASPMGLVTDDLRAPTVINSYLDEELLQAFEQKNLCDTCLLNSDAFMILPE